jgi:hypothetical protein
VEKLDDMGRKPQAASRKPQAASRKPQAASRKPQAASPRIIHKFTSLSSPLEERAVTYNKITFNVRRAG